MSEIPELPELPEVPHRSGRAAVMETTVPLWLVGAGICGALAAGIVLGMRAGKAIGSARLAPPPKVQPIYVRRCATCEQLADEWTPAEVERTVAKQEEVERATDH